MRFRVNRPDTVHETFDDEIVLLNLRTGNYYSLDASAVALWNHIECGMEVEDIVSAIAVQAESEARRVRPMVHAFLQELEEESLIVGEQDAAASALGSPVFAQDSLPAPKLMRFSDMQNLFLLDPIHEVKDSGWPRALDDSAAAQAR